MPKIYVHDFYFECSEIENNDGENDFCCSVSVYYNFSPEDPGDDWDNLEYLNITVANPFGLAKYLGKCIKTGIFSDCFFYPHVLIFDKKNDDRIMNFIRRELQAIEGKSEKELILKAIRNFDWEYEGTPEVYNKLFR